MKISKKITALLMACLLITGTVSLPQGVFADPDGSGTDGNVAVNTTTQVSYTSLSSALTSAADGETVELLSNATITAKTVVANDVILEGNGYNIYIAVTASNTTDARGIQTSSTADFSIRNANIIGTDETGIISNKGRGLMVWKGKMTLENVNISDFTNSFTTKTGAAIFVNDGELSLTNVVFSNNSATYGPDVYLGNFSDGATVSPVLTLSGNINSKGIYKGSQAAINVTETFNIESGILLQLPDGTAENDKLIEGMTAAPKNANKCFSLASAYVSQGLAIDADGVLSKHYIAKVGTEMFTTMKEALAVAASKSTKTVVLIDDVEITERLNYSKDYIGVTATTGLVITDDGQPRNIYIYSTGSGSDARGFQINFSQLSYNATIKGTSLGKLTIYGHNPAGTVYNQGPLFYAYGGTIKLTNVIVKECMNGALYTTVNKSSTSETIYSGGFDVTNSQIINNSSEKGSAIYSEGGVITISGSTITGNLSTGKTAGAVYLADKTVESTTKKATLTISGKNTVSGNYKGCSIQDGEIMADGSRSDIYFGCSTPITVMNSASGSYGIDGLKEGTFASVSGTPSTSQQNTLTSAFTSNVDITVLAKYSSNKLSFQTFSYTASLGAASKTGGLTYKLPSFSLTTNENSASFNIAMSNGSMNINWPDTSIAVTSYQAVLENGKFVSGTSKPSQAASYRAISITGSGLSASSIQSFVRSIVFSAEESGVPGRITFGMHGPLSSSETYYGGYIYSYVNTELSWRDAFETVTGMSKDLAGINDAYTNEFLRGTFGNDGWLAGTRTANAWFWLYKDSSVQLTGNTFTSEGYNGAYTNFADGYPKADGTGLYFSAADGKWKTASADTKKGAFTQKSDPKAVSAEFTITDDSRTNCLVSLAPTFENGIGMKYYFAFSNAILKDANAYVKITVGDLAPQKNYVKDIVSANNRNSRGNYAVTVLIDPAYLADDIIVQLYNGSDKLIVSYGVKSPCNFLYYASHIIENKENGDAYNYNFSETTINMTKALLHYGAAAQILFDHNTGNLADKDYPDTSPMTEASDIMGGYLKKSSSNITTGTLVSASSLTELNMAFKLTDGTAVTSIKIDGSDMPMTETSDGFKMIRIKVMPGSLGHIYSVSINGGAYTVEFNTYYILKLLLGSTAQNSAAAKAAADKLYKFGRAADAHYGSYEVNSTAIETVLNTAYAFLGKEEYTQYDMNSAYATASSVTISDVAVPQGRRQLFAIPEEMTDYHSDYLDCSSFCYSVYRSIYGQSKTINALVKSGYRSLENMRTYSLTYYPNTTALVKSYTSMATKTWYKDSDTSSYISNWTKAIEDAKKVMQPGDLLVYNGYSSSGTQGGHILLWTGNGFIHCTGASYDMTNQVEHSEADGAVHFIPADSFGYSYFKKHGAIRANILRPLNVLGTETASEYGQARTQLGSMGISALGVDNTSGVKLYDGQSVSVGDNLSYTIILDNKKMSGNLTPERTVDVTYTMPSQFSITSADMGGTVSGKTVTWKNVTVGVDATCKLTLTGQVTSGSARDIFSGGSGTVSISQAGQYAVAIPFNAQPVEIENKLSNTVISAIKGLTTAKAKTYFNTGSDMLVNVNNILSGVTGQTVNFGTSADALFDANFKLGTSYYSVKAKAWSGFMVSNFAAGKNVYNRTVSDEGDGFSYKNRCRMLFEENFKIGDVIMTNKQSSDTKDFYIYTGNDTLIHITSTAVSESSLASLIELMLGRSQFIVLRALGR